MAMRRLHLVLLVAGLPLGILAQWPDCIENGFDYEGVDVISGYRFNNKDCAHWCQIIGSRCVKWIYKEVGSQCFLKNTAGNKTATSVEMAPLTHSGDPNCSAPIFEGWKDCARENMEITGDDHPNATLAAAFFTTDIETCSYKCFTDSECTHWQYNELTKDCYRKVVTASAPVTSPSSNVWYGSKECVGLVNEEEGGGPKIDGGWSPWSAIATPCINKRTGKRVLCGGGVNIRYRSCTHPEPRYGGKVCAGSDSLEFSCNTHNCALPDEYLWSEWGLPDKPCEVGIQRRTTLCGALRSRLPPLENSNDEEPAVYWPTCLVPFPNSALALNSLPGQTMQSCITECQASDICKHWSFNFNDSKCELFDIFSIESYQTKGNLVTGEKACFGALFAPYCGEYQKTYPGVSDISSPHSVEAMDDCAANCTANANCKNWFVQISKADGSITCTLKGAIPSGTAPTASTDTDRWVYFGPRSCEKGVNTPSLPENAKELSYKEMCTDNQYREEERVVNTWDLEHCDRPCDNHEICPRYAACYDLSTIEGQNHECICQLGKIMEGGKCIDPPNSTPAPREIPTMTDSDRKSAQAATRASYFFLILFTALTLTVFTVFKIFNPGRFIHMNIEIALLLAHLCLMPDFARSEGQNTCRNISICIHFFYTAAFAFYVVEGVYIYSIVAYVVKNNGIMSNMGNFMAGWGIAIVVIAFTVSFEYDNYGGGPEPYQCFLQINTSLIYGEFIPIVLLSVMAVMLMEAGYNVDEDSMQPLEGMDEKCYESAKYMLKSFFFRVFLTFCSFTFGSAAFYTYNNGILYAIFVVFTLVLGIVIFIGHCASDEMIRAKMGEIKEKVCGKKKVEETDTEPIITQ